MARFKYLLLILTTGFVVSAIFIVGQNQSQEQGVEKNAAVEASRLLDLITAAFEQYSERLATELTRVIEAELTSSETTSWLTNSSFEAVALAEPNEVGTWNLEWVKSADQGQQSFDFSGWLPRVGKDAVSDNRFLFRTVTNIRKEPRVLFGVQLRVKSGGNDLTKIGLGILPVTEVASVLASVKGTELEGFVVDKDGNALTYPDPRYVGSRMDIHPIVSTLLKSSTARTIGPFLDLQQKPTMGGYKKIPKTGTAVVVNIPTVEPAGRRQGFVTLVLISCAITFILALLAFAMSSSDRSGLQMFKERAAQLQVQLRNLQNESRQFETVSVAHRHWSRSVSGYLRSPVYSMLGEVQKLKEKYKAGDALAFLEDELRKVKDFVESLNSRAGDSNAESNFLVGEKAAEILHRQKESFERRGVELLFIDDPQATIYGNPGDFQTGLDLLLQYLLKEMSSSQGGKQISVSVHFEHGTVEFKLTVPVAGLPEDLAEVMAMQTDRHVSLAVANGLFKAMGGVMSIQPGINGTSVRVRFPAASAGTAEISKAAPAAAPTPTKPPEPPELESKKSTRAETVLLTKKVTEELDRILPPEPEKQTQQDVSVVDELTATLDLTEPKVKIRKPRVRYDT